MLGMEAYVQVRIEIFGIEPDAQARAAFFGEVEPGQEGLAEVDAHRGCEFENLLFDFFKDAFAVTAFRIAEIDGVCTFGRNECVERFVGDAKYVCKP